MANPGEHKTPPRTHIGINALLSPPAMERTESFGSSIGVIHPSIAPSNCDFSKPTMYKPAPSQPGVGHMYNTPPFSPQKSFSSPSTSGSPHMVETSSSHGLRDPQIYVRADDASSTKDYPLFETAQESEPSHLDNQITLHMQSSVRPRDRPTLDEYRLVATFQSTVFDEIRKNPREFFKREREYDNLYGGHGAQATHKRHKQQESKRLAPAPSSHVKDKVAIPRINRTPRTPKRTPKAAPTPSDDGMTAMAAVMPAVARRRASTPTVHSRKPAKMAKPEADFPWKDEPDYCPPLSTLDAPDAKKLKADWKSGPFLDIAGEPDAQYMHKDEITLARTLRLHCHQYLHSKRRIFAKCVEMLRQGLEIRKTHAQQACSIDVNKASKLWVAYNNVGWFDRKHFQQYL